MGIMICEIHGRVGFVETCSHVAKQIDEQRLPMGHRFTILGHLFVCDDCFKSLGFERCIGLADLPIEEAPQIPEFDDARWGVFDAAYGRIDGRHAFCLKCVAELEQQHLSV
jgi:hypothetical protein